MRGQAGENAFARPLTVAALNASPSGLPFQDPNCHHLIRRRELIKRTMRPPHRSRFFLVLLIGFWAAGQGQACADQVILTNGDRISGRFIAFSRESVQIDTEFSGIIRIERKHVKQLSTDDPVAIDLVSGERVVGRIMAGEGKTIQIRSSILGDRRLSLDSIDAIQASPQTGGSETSVQLSDVAGKGTGSSAAPESQATKSAETQTPKSIGQKPEDEADIRKIFLRQITVLLRPGQVEVEAAVHYLRNQSVSPILNAKFRRLQIPLAARIGLFHGAEGYVVIPPAFAHRELTFAGSSASNREFGLGDASAGFNYELARETARWPDIVASASLGTPTGNKPNEAGLSLGSGHWAATFGLQFIKTVDPVALFWGVDYSHQFEARYFLNDAVHTVKPGETAGYNFGFGFAVNENVSLSAQVSGSYQSPTKADGVKVAGSSNEPVSLRSALTYRYSRRTYIEPSVAIGLDDETPDFVLGISLTHRLGK